MTLCLFDVPMDLVRMSRMPATSRTGRTPPPAITPVPGGRQEQHLRRAEEALDLVRDGALHQRDLEQVALRAVRALADRFGNFVRLAETGTDVTVLVADDDERREREPTAALDDLGDAIDVDDAVDELADFFRIDASDLSLRTSVPLRGLRQQPP